MKRKRRPLVIPMLATGGVVGLLPMFQLKEDGLGNTDAFGNVCEVWWDLQIWRGSRVHFIVQRTLDYEAHVDPDLYAFREEIF